MARSGRQGDKTVELFRDFWWRMFPIVGMGIAVWDMVHEDRCISQSPDRTHRDLEQR